MQQCHLCHRHGLCAPDTGCVPPPHTQVVSACWGYRIGVRLFSWHGASPAAPSHQSQGLSLLLSIPAALMPPAALLIHPETTPTSTTAYLTSYSLRIKCPGRFLWRCMAVQHTQIKSKHLECPALACW